MIKIINKSKMKKNNMIKNKKNQNITNKTKNK